MHKLLKWFVFGSVYFIMNHSYTQNILPNFGFERDVKEVSNEKLGNEVSCFCLKQNVVDSCNIYVAQYYNRNRAQSCAEIETKGFLVLPFRGKALVTLSVSSVGGGGVVFKLRRPLIKDSIYFFSCFLNFSNDSICPDYLNFGYCSKRFPQDMNEFKTHTAFPSQINVGSFKNEYTYTQLSGYFKALENANYFIISINDSTVKRLKRGTIDISIDNVFLQKKSSNTLSNNKFSLEKLECLKNVSQVFILNDTVFNSVKRKEILDFIKEENDFLIQVHYPDTEIGEKQKEMVELFFKRIKYNESQITFIKRATNAKNNNVNILFF